MPPHLPQTVSYVSSSTILQSSRAREFCSCAALVLTQTSFPKVRQVGISANCLGDGGSFRLVNLQTNWRQERAKIIQQVQENRIQPPTENKNMPPHLPQTVSYVSSSTILQSSRAREFCSCAALVLTQTSFPKVRQVGISANCLGDGGSFRLVNSHTNWRKERATRLVQKEVVVGSHFSTSYLTEMNGIFGVKMHQSNPMLRVDSFEPFLLNIYIYIYIFIYSSTI